jgi:hypothetical protein
MNRQGRCFGRGWGQGFGRGWGQGFGRGWGQGILVEKPENIGNVASDEKLQLEKQFKSLKDQLAEMETRLESLDVGKKR